MLLSIYQMFYYISLNTNKTGHSVERKRVRLWSGGLKFKSRAGQIEHSVAYGSTPLRHLFERNCVAQA